MEPTHESQPAAFALPPAPAAPHQNEFFFGRFGLRAGYGIGIYLVFFIILSSLAAIFAAVASGHLHEIMAARAQASAHPNAPRPAVHPDFGPAMVMVNDGITFLGLLAMSWFFHKAERRPLRSYGIGSNRIVDVLPGAFWGVAMLSAVVAILHAKGLLIFNGQNDHGSQIFTYGSAWFLAFLLVGFSEEYTFRGYIQYTLMRGFWGLAEKVSATNTRFFAFWFAAIFWSGAFACAHLFNAGENTFGLFQVFLAGIVFSYALWRTGSLWWGIGFHCTWDWAQSFLFGVADSGNISVGRLFVTHAQGKALLSGGEAGPEGSIFATVALILTIVILRFTTRSGAQPAMEQEPIVVTPAPSVVPV